MTTKDIQAVSTDSSTALSKYRDPYAALNVDFLITYEHKAREMESVCLVKNELERRGYTVGLTTTYHERRMQFVDRRSASVVITPALYHDGSLFAFVYWIAGACRKVVNMQWEQALTNQNESDPSFFQNPKGAARRAVHLCWGDEPQQRLLRAGVPRERAAIVGPVQMDALRPEMRRLHMSREAVAALNGLNVDREWVLFISSFSYINMSAEEFETELKCVGPSLADFVRISVTSQTAILEWLVEACRRFPEKIFIYRPHPSETADPRLEALSREHENFRVIKEYSVRQWIVCSDRIFTWYSTSGAEVFFAGKSCAVLRPVPIPTPLDVSIFRNARMVERLDQFMDSLADRDTHYTLDADLIAQYFAVDPERATFLKVCDLLEDVLRTDKYDMPPISRAHAAYHYAQRIRHRAFFVAKEVISRNRALGFLRRIGWVEKKVENHEALVGRMRTNRPKSFATVEELAQMDALINEIRAAEDEGAAPLESCLSNS